MTPSHAAPRRFWLHFLPCVFATILGALGFVFAGSGFSFFVAICGIVAFAFAFGAHSAFANGDIAEAEPRLLVAAMVGWSAFVLGLLWSFVLYYGTKVNRESTKFLKFMYAGRNIAEAVQNENMQREFIKEESSVWPGCEYSIYDKSGNKVKDVTATTYTTSSEYFDDLVRYGVVEYITGYGIFSGLGVPIPREGETLSDSDVYNAWCCIAVQGGDVSGDPPFLFTRNLLIGDADLQAVLRPGCKVDSDESWADKLDPEAKGVFRSRVVIVNRSGFMKNVRARDLTPAKFFGDAIFSDPSKVRVLPAH